MTSLENNASFRCKEDRVKTYVPDERYNIKGGRVGVTQEFHKNIDDTCCNFGEFDGSDVD